MKARPLKKRNSVKYGRFSNQKGSFVVKFDCIYPKNGVTSGVVVESDKQTYWKVGDYNEIWSYGLDSRWTLLENYTPTKNP